MLRAVQVILVQELGGASASACTKREGLSGDTTGTGRRIVAVRPGTAVRHSSTSASDVAHETANANDGTGLTGSRSLIGTGLFGHAP
ncbi:MAG: hypothetical protein RL430_1027 [Actinomycetota bacterium]